MIAERKVSVRQACIAAQLSRTVWGYVAKPREEAALRAALLRLSAQYPGKGFGQLFRLLQREGWTDNHKRVRRVYNALGLQIRRKPRRRLSGTTAQPEGAACVPDACWSLDFMSDSTRGGRKLRVLTVLDDFTRRAICIEIDTSLPTLRVI